MVGSERDTLLLKRKLFSLITMFLPVLIDFIFLHGRKLKEINIFCLYIKNK